MVNIDSVHAEEVQTGQGKLLSTIHNVNAANTALSPYAKQTIKENLPQQNQSIHLEGNGWLYTLLYSVLLTMALCSALPVIIFFIEHNLAGLHAFNNHFKKCKDYTPNVAVIIPAWNEALVLEHTIDILLKMDYPPQALRVYVIDDGSTDDTELVLNKMQLQFPENIFHVRKNGGGKGKSHAVNYGLDVILAEPWAQAIMIIDADISFKKDALRRLARHLADPEVGAVTSYIKVGNRKVNYITRSIGYEYIVSQSIARRAQNVLGVIACLAGGAQLHTRENIEALGGKINTQTLAEDTYTTFATQKLGKIVIFEGNSFVYAEEPKSMLGLWPQRFRWARGNIQITKAFKDVWFRRKYFQLGSIYFGLLWFCVLLTPFFMIASAIGLLGLFFLNIQASSKIFFHLAYISLFLYLYTTIFAIIVDKRTSRLSWIEGVIYPGLITISILLFSLDPSFFFMLLDKLFNIKDPKLFNSFMLLLMETWSALCMLLAWLVFRLEYAGVSPRITTILLIIVGYGPFLCVINLAAFIAEIKNPSLRWDKTEKVNTKREIRPHEKEMVFDFDKALAKDIRREYRFFCHQITTLITVIGIFLLFYI